MSEKQPNISAEYREQLRREHDGSNWGSSAVRMAGQDIIALLNERPYIHTVLDYGCGKGLLQPHIRQHVTRAVEFTEYDPGIIGKDKLPEGQFDLVVTADVLEHIEPACINTVLKELQAKTKFVLYNNIACHLTNRVFASGPFKGQDLHILVQEPAVWRELLDEQLNELELFEFQEHTRRMRGNPVSRCLAVHERCG